MNITHVLFMAIGVLVGCGITAFMQGTAEINAGKEAQDGPNQEDTDR